MADKRNYGIDLLRIILMYGVCVLHVLGKGGVLDSCQKGTMNHAIFWLLEIVAYCAVDTFALISGYMAKDKPQKYEKLVGMWIQAFFYSFIVTLPAMALLCVNPGAKQLIKLALPVTFNSFWYFTAYFALFFAIPLLNRALFTLDETAAKRLLIVTVILYSVICTVNDAFNTNFGYSALWLIVLYTIGVLAKRIGLFDKTRWQILLAIIAGCWLVQWMTYLVLGTGRQYSYTSPLTILTALAVIALFSRLKLPDGAIKAVRHLSPLAFGIYLFQMNHIVWNNVINELFQPLANMNTAVGVMLALLSALAIFLCGLIVEAMRNWLHKMIKAERLCEIVARFISTFIDRLTVLIR